MRRIWEPIFLEGSGWTQLGVAAAVALLLYGPARRRLARWVGRAARGWRQLAEEVRHSPAVRVGLPLAAGAAVAATAGAVTAGAATAGATALGTEEGAATALPAAVAAVPVALQGIHTAVETKDLLDHVLDGDEDEPCGELSRKDPDPPADRC